MYGPIIVEEYIDGREFNISLIGSQTTPRYCLWRKLIFPDFLTTCSKLSAIGLNGNLIPSNIRRRGERFPYLPDTMIARKMSAVSVQCYQLFGLRDYGRVDLRLDKNGKVYVLEINANPCLSPDAGFPAAVQKSGLDYTAMVEKFVSFVKARSI